MKEARGIVEDAELVRRSLAGDDDAFAELVTRYKGLVFKIVRHFFARSEDAEDVAQEAFLKLYSSLERFDPNQSLAPWAIRITINACYDALRESKRNKELSLSEVTEEEGELIDHMLAGALPAGPEVENRLAAKALVDRLLLTLPPKDRLVIVLRELEELPFKDIARMLGMSERAVIVRASRARQSMRKALDRLRRHKR